MLADHACPLSLMQLCTAIHQAACNSCAGQSGGHQLCRLLATHWPAGVHTGLSCHERCKGGSCPPGGSACHTMTSHICTPSPPAMTGAGKQLYSKFACSLATASSVLPVCMSRRHMLASMATRASSIAAHTSEGAPSCMRAARSALSACVPKSTAFNSLSQ